MTRGVRITDKEKSAIKAALERKPHAMAVARASKGRWSYSTVWRVADDNDIALTAGRETMGRHRLTAEQREAVREISRANPKAKQADIARVVGVSRPSVSRIEGGRRRPRGSAGGAAAAP
jgi:hypothetical protein